MTVGRWLLVHSFSIFLVTLFILGYIYRDELQLEHAYQQLLKQPSKSVSGKVQPSEPVKESIADQQSSAAHRSTSKKPIEKAPETSSSAETTPGYIESTPTLSRTIIDLNEQLLEARKAYWDKDYPLAIKHYKQLIQDDETNPDYIGELGNIYYSLNDYDNAARHFYQAALILISQEKPEQARLLISPISAMNRDLGDQLEGQLKRP